MKPKEGQHIEHDFTFVAELSELLTKHGILEAGQYAKPFRVDCYSSKKDPLVGTLRFRIDDKP